MDRWLILAGGMAGALSGLFVWYAVDFVSGVSAWQIGAGILFGGLPGEPGQFLFAPDQSWRLGLILATAGVLTGASAFLPHPRGLALALATLVFLVPTDYMVQMLRAVQGARFMLVTFQGLGIWIAVIGGLLAITGGLFRVAGRNQRGIGSG